MSRLDHTFEEKRPVVKVDVPELSKIFLVRLLPTSLAHVVPGRLQCILQIAVPKHIVKS